MNCGTYHIFGGSVRVMVCDRKNPVGSRVIDPRVLKPSRPVLTRRLGGGICVDGQGTPY